MQVVVEHGILSDTTDNYTPVLVCPQRGGRRRRAYSADYSWACHLIHHNTLIYFTHLCQRALRGAAEGGSAHSFSASIKAWSFPSNTSQYSNSIYTPVPVCPQRGSRRRTACFAGCSWACIVLSDTIDKLHTCASVPSEGRQKKEGLFCRL